MLSLIIWTISGGLIGWVASMVMRRDPGQSAYNRILIGSLGGFIGGFVFDGEATPSVVRFGSVFAAVVGAVIVLSIANLVFPRPALR